MIPIKKIMILLFPMLLLCMTGLSPEAVAVDDWTFMVYLDGDNNLEAAGIDDFLEMSSVGSSANVNIIVLFDRISGHDSSYGNWTYARRGIVNSGDVPNSSWGTSVGEVNMGDPQTLIDFVEWGIQTYPANRYAVVLWDHGSGWRAEPEEEEIIYKSVCSDDTSGDRLYMSEVRAALNTIETDEQEVDITGFDACLMGMIEVAYEIRQHSSVMVGSEKMEPNDGWPYNTILTDLLASPTMSSSTLGSTIVTRYYASYSNSEIMSAISLSEYYINALATRVDSFARTLRSDWNTTPGTCAAAAYRVKEAVSDVVLAEAHGSLWPGTHGLAIYFPEDSYNFNSDYNDSVILFPGATQWEEFLQDFYSSMGGSWVATARDNSQEYDTSNAAGMQGHHIDLYDFCLKIITNASDTIWVDFLWGGIEHGTYSKPFNTLAEAVTAASGGETICIKAGSSDETITITKAVRIEACGGTVTIGE